jgi:hypothetical protein
MRPRKVLGFVGAVLLLLAAAVLGMAVYSYFTKGEGLAAVLALGGSLVYLGLYFFVFIPFRLRRIYRQQKLLQDQLLVEISDTHMVIKSQHGQGVLPWEVFHKWKTARDLVLVYQSDVLFHIFPQRAFSSPQEYQQFQSLLRSKLGPQRP